MLTWNILQHINPFLAHCSIFIRLKMSENLWFSKVFRGYWHRTLGWNGLIETLLLTLNTHLLLENMNNKSTKSTISNWILFDTSVRKPYMMCSSAWVVIKLLWWQPGEHRVFTISHAFITFILSLHNLSNLCQESHFMTPGEPLYKKYI